jgi:hypothetical protein
MINDMWQQSVPCSQAVGLEQVDDKLGLASAHLHRNLVPALVPHTSNAGQVPGDLPKLDSWEVQGFVILSLHRSFVLLVPLRRVRCCPAEIGKSSKALNGPEKHQQWPL